MGNRLNLLAVALLASNCTVLASARVVRVSDFGYDPEDSTLFLQAALDSGAQTVVIDRQNGPWVTLPLLARSDTTVAFEPGVELQAKRGAFMGVRDYLFTVRGVANVTILGSDGARMKMHKSDYQKPPYPRSEWRFTLRIESSTNVTVQGMAFVESGGDGIVVTGASKDVTIRDCLCDGNHRQGISVCSAENLLIENCVLRNTSGTAPAAGIDLEPDKPWEKLKNIVIRDCLSENNDGDGFQSYLAALSGASEEISVTFERCRSIGNHRGFWFDLAAGRNYETMPKGFFRFTDCIFKGSRDNGICILGKPAGTIDFSFEDCVVANCGKNQSVSPVRIGSSHGYSQPPTDDVHFDGLTVRTDEGRDWIGCDRSSFSTQRVANVTGNVRIVRNDTGREEHVALDDAFAAERLPPRYSGALPPRTVAVDADLGKAVVHNAAPGHDVALSRFWFFEGAKYVFHASESGMLTFTGRTRPSQAREPEFYNPAYHKGKVVVRPVTGGEPILCDAPGPDGGPINVTVPASGFYTMSFERRGTDFALETSPVPVAIDTRERFVQMMFDGYAPTALWIGGAASGAVALVRGGTYSGSRAHVALSSAKDQIEQCVADGDWHPLPVPASANLLRLSFSPIPDKPFTFFAIDMLGTPGFFFLSPDKIWAFAK